jgi:hypothetical protein
MATFPTLRTGAVAQYPLARSLRFPAQSVQFLDGSRQNYQLSGGGLRQWLIRLNQLDEAEAAALIAFAETQRGTQFLFTDPVTGDVIANCVIGQGPSGKTVVRAGIAAGREAWAEIRIEEVL